MVCGDLLPNLNGSALIACHGLDGGIISSAITVSGFGFVVPALLVLNRLREGITKITVYGGGVR